MNSKLDLRLRKVLDEFERDYTYLSGTKDNEEPFFDNLPTSTYKLAYEFNLTVLLEAVRFYMIGFDDTIVESVEGITDRNYTERETVGRIVEELKLALDSFAEFYGK